LLRQDHAESFRQSRTQGEAEERNVQWTFRRPNADISRAASLGRGGLRDVAFQEVRFPDDISRGARGGPGRRARL
jgi:hypothetical protein